MSADRVYQVSDQKSKLECSLTVLRGSDGGASAVGVELRNPSGDEVVLKVNTEMPAFIMLTVADQQGTVLSKPARKFDTSETQQFDFVRIAPGSSHRWRVPVAAQLDATAIPGQQMRGRLVVNVALVFARVSAGEQSANADFQTSILTLYDMDVLFTRAALDEGMTPPSAER